MTRNMTAKGREHESLSAFEIASRVSILSEIELFADLSRTPNALESLAHFLCERQFATGHLIIEEGKLGDELFVLIKGSVSVSKTTLAGDSFTVAQLNDTQHVCFGEGGLLDGEARSASIRADSSARCLILNRANFLEFASKYPQWALPVILKIAAKVMSRLRKSNSDLILLHNALVTEIRG